jgi:type II secretory pathway predicted ATPase ExeA
MDLAETNTYIKTHLARAGRTQTLFADDATAEIWQASRGWPRAVSAGAPRRLGPAPWK